MNNNRIEKRQNRNCDVKAMAVTHKYFCLLQHLQVFFYWVGRAIERDIIWKLAKEHCAELTFSSYQLK